MRKSLEYRNGAGYSFLAPAIIFYIIFFLFPVIFSLLVSFKKWNMLIPFSKAPFIGWKNFLDLFKDDLFLMSLRNTLLYAILTVTISLTISLFYAVMINKARFSVLWRFIYFAPVVTPQVAIATIWGYLYNPNSGLLNTILRFFGLKGLNWLTDPNIALFSIIITAIWAGIGGSMLIFTASLRNIPQEYYDAAKIDGATGFKEFWYITLPLLKPTLLFLSATGLIGAWQVFDLPYMLGRNAPAKSVMTVSWYTYETAFQYLRMGRASAGAFLLFIIIFIITLIVLWIFRKGGIKGYE
ncbi:MAG: sugar ABC transporter permease [Dictyoglomaceae bacterium]|nr:sugar ABC transporter permease [Dictyoglomaceae bacterium]